MIHRIQKLLLLTMALLTLGSCAKDPVQDTTQGKQINLGLSLDTYASGDANADENETKITEAYVFIFNASGLLENPGNTKVLPSTGGVLVDAAGRLNATWRVHEGVKDIYVILNPHKVGFLTQGTVTPSPAEIDLATWNPSKADFALLITPSSLYENYYYTSGKWSSWPPTCTQGMLMTGKIEGVSVTSAAMDVTVPVQRRYARVDISLRRAKELFDIPIDCDAKAKVDNMAAQTRLYDGTPLWNSSEFVTDQPSTFYYQVESGVEHIRLHAVENEDGTGDYQQMFSFYVMPMPYGSAPVWVESGKASVVINMNTTYGTYKIPISELDYNNKPDPERPRDIEPNKIYKVNATLNSRSIDVEIKVLDWEDQNIEGDIAGTTLSVSQSKVVMDWWNLGQKFNTDVYYVSDGTVEFVGYVVKKTDGSETVSIDGSNLPTWLPFGKIINLPSGSTPTGRIGLEYVPTADEHPDVILRIKTGNIIKDITVVYDNGFLPNAVLTSPGNWTTNQPDRGLHLAKRGNVLPNGVALADDVQMQWSPLTTTKIGADVQFEGVGYGDANTNGIMASTSGPGSAAAACRALGSEWYLSSLDELKTLYNTRLYAGPSFSFDTSFHYWSSTESSNSHDKSMSMYFFSSITGNAYKDNSSIGVRCVRNLDLLTVSTERLMADYAAWGNSFSTDVEFESHGQGAVSVTSIDNSGSTKDWLVSAIVSGTTKGKIRVTYKPTSVINTGGHQDVTITLEASGGATKVITVVYDNGFLPNAILTTHGGWTTNLPATGIQLAKRGNVLPNGVNSYDEAMIPWREAGYSYEVGVAAQNLGVGFGKANTDAIMASLVDFGSGTAAAVCRALGPEWYLPSRDEVVMLRNTRGYSAGPSYFLITSNYWSSTEGNATLSWYANILYDETKQINKEQNLYVRCVRDL